MIRKDSVVGFQEKIKSLKAELPTAHVVLGSGFGTALKDLDPNTWKPMGEIAFQEIPGLIQSTVQDHAGKYALYQYAPSKKFVLFQMGRLHGYEGHDPRQVVQTVMIPRAAGIQNFILTNAAGGLLRAMNPGDVMIIDDHVNLTGKNPLIGHNPVDHQNKELGPRFPDMGNCYQPQWRNRIEKNLAATGLKVHRGIYLGLLGPTFETHAEVRLYAQWGMGSVGMSTVWETIALHHSGAKVAGLSLISNLGAGLSDAKLDHETILETCRASASRAMKGLTDFMAQDLLQ